MEDELLLNLSSSSIYCRGCGAPSVCNSNYLRYIKELGSCPRCRGRADVGHSDSGVQRTGGTGCGQ